MMKKGARNFAFLSRSGADSLQASILVEALEAAGANVQVMRGDASVRSDVDRAVRDVPNDRLIRGVIQAAMVLKVRNCQALDFCDGHINVDIALGWTVPQHAVRELDRLDETQSTRDHESPCCSRRGSSGFLRDDQFRLRHSRYSRSK